MSGGLCQGISCSAGLNDCGVFEAHLVFGV